MDADKNLHNGHRQRLKDRFLTDGLRSFNEINKLELLLFYAIPRRDTNPIAHRLLDRFGSLSAVLEAEPALLTEVDGIYHIERGYETLVEKLSAVGADIRTIVVPDEEAPAQVG